MSAVQPLKISILGIGGLGCPLVLLLSELLSELDPGISHVVDVYDGDPIELSNLNRQILFGEEDVGRPKTEVASSLFSGAGRALLNRAPADSSARFNFIHKRITDPSDLDQITTASDIVIDCTDDPTTKIQLNDLCISRGLGENRVCAYIYTGAVGTSGVCLPIFPGKGCLRCAFDGIDSNDEGSRREVCSSAGIWGPVAGMIAVKVAAIIRQILNGDTPASELFRYELRGQRSSSIQIQPSASCPLGCAHGRTRVADLRDIPCPRSFVVAKLALEQADSSPVGMLFKDIEQFNQTSESLAAESARLVADPYTVCDGSIRAIFISG